MISFKLIKLKLILPQNLRQISVHVNTFCLAVVASNPSHTEVVIQTIRPVNHREEENKTWNQEFCCNGNSSLYSAKDFFVPPVN